MINKREEGNLGEDLAVSYLLSKGATILERNYRVKDAEIDIIYLDGGYISFAEVKYRKNSSYGEPYEAVGYGKRKKICKASRVYLYTHHIPENTLIRYDIISILGNVVTLYENAFDYVN